MAIPGSGARLTASVSQYASPKWKRAAAERPQDPVSNSPTSESNFPDLRSAFLLAVVSGHRSSKCARRVVTRFVRTYHAQCSPVVFMGRRGNPLVPRAGGSVGVCHHAPAGVHEPSASPHPPRRSLRRAPRTQAIRAEGSAVRMVDVRRSLRGWGFAGRLARTLCLSARGPRATRTAQKLGARRVRYQGICAPSDP
jgi:hypothetical protein